MTQARITALSTYRPPWAAGEGRACGRDEDVATLAVAAGLALAHRAAAAERIVLITAAPDFLEPDPGPVINAALGLPPSTPVERRLGGGPAALRALTDAAPGTVVICVSPGAPAGAAAALIGGDGAVLTADRTTTESLPVRVVPARSPQIHEYEDARLVRDRGVRPALGAVFAGANGSPVAVTGVSAAELRRLGIDSVDTPAVGGAAAPLFALAAIAAQRAGVVVAVDGAAAASARLERGAVQLECAEREPIAGGPPAEPPPARIPISLPAYARAFEAKVGMLAARCACGELSFPPRALCLRCGRLAATELVPLPRAGEIYTTVTVRTPVPGMPQPYSLAIVALDDVEVRVLAGVTDAPAGSVAIGDRGELVLRRVALRDGVPDYGYAFAPSPRTATDEEAAAVAALAAAPS